MHKERPILFSAPMVRALLDGSKTQTRRALRLQPPDWATHSFWGRDTRLYSFCEGNPIQPVRTWSADGKGMLCPYGRPGDRLWVRETWQYYDGGNIYDPAGGVIDTMDGQTEYRASRPSYPGPWKPSIFMPRWASRITLEVTAVRVERLQDISEADAFAEGVKEDKADGFFESIEGRFVGVGPQDTYAQLWESINGPNSWAANPWVWVIEFKKLKP